MAVVFIFLLLLGCLTIIRENILLLSNGGREVQQKCNYDYQKHHGRFSTHKILSFVE
jgi:hypothetical protein